MLIYIFLIEKVNVVWNGLRGCPQKRLHSKVYLCCIALFAVYVGVAAVVIVGRIAYFQKDGTCVIGLKARLALVAHIRPSAVRTTAVRSVRTAAIALTTSCINILVLTLEHGQQLGWVCLASCGTDVVINAVVLCWATAVSQPKPSTLTTSGTCRKAKSSAFTFLPPAGHTGPLTTTGAESSLPPSSTEAYDDPRLWRRAPTHTPLPAHTTLDLRQALSLSTPRRTHPPENRSAVVREGGPGARGGVVVMREMEVGADAEGGGVRRTPSGMRVGLRRPWGAHVEFFVSHPVRVRLHLSCVVVSITQLAFDDDPLSEIEQQQRSTH
ncbi:uncharacterized protein BXZ73DRAFT_74699 [Epithele typhae]|uniref:uncharacterized protein n=1 Tax=Epithele typhae TaxID=378194 RepID=UPI002007D4BD|nr:uncharacterized protein BXZ73DRAFT_74699 [Epithele typhae]KAH9942442.1 hypothetical protein BXZ73DRAFT_74699 [Epithele typhae]